MADEIGFGAVGRDQHDADDAAGGGCDVLLFGARARRSGKSQEGGQQRGEATEQCDHDWRHSYAMVGLKQCAKSAKPLFDRKRREARSEEHTSELQSLMRISYAVFC